MIKRLFALILVSGMMSGVGRAEVERVKIGDLYYNLDMQEKTAQVTWELLNSMDNYKSLTDVTIPVSVNYQEQDFSVKAVGLKAFAYCTTGITSVSIPEGVTCISDSAFYGCEKLNGVVIPNSVESIGVDAFCYCYAITEASLGSSLKSIAREAFNGCRSITTITIPDNVERISDNAFSGCKALTTVNIGSGLTSLGGYVFNLCSSLAEINVSAENPAYCSEDGVLLDKGKTAVLRYPTTKAGEYVVPGSVTKIEKVAFAECQALTAVTLPNGLITIDDAAFNTCTALKELVIPNSVTTVGGSAFSACSGITTLTIGSGLTSIGSTAFLYCTALKTVYNYAVTPQEIDFVTFYNVNIADCKLYVPEGSVDLYEAANVWENFGTILPIDPTGIQIVESSELRVESDAPIYDLNGRRLSDKPKRGYYIQGGKKYLEK